MSDPAANPSDPTDEQSTAELTDEDKIDPLDFPPDEPMGVGHVGEVPAEDAGGESLAERAEAEEPEVWEQPLRTDEDAGMLVDPDEGAATDVDKELVGDEVPFAEQPAAEEAAVHIVEP